MLQPNPSVPPALLVRRPLRRYRSFRCCYELVILLIILCGGIAACGAIVSF